MPLPRGWTWRRQINLTTFHVSGSWLSQSTFWIKTGSRHLLLHYRWIISLVAVSINKQFACVSGTVIHSHLVSNRKCSKCSTSTFRLINSGRIATKAGIKIKTSKRLLEHTHQKEAKTKKFTNLLGCVSKAPKLFAKLNVPKIQMF